MNIEASILADRSNENIWKIAHYIVDHPEHLESLWLLITEHSDTNIRMRAAWALGKIVEVDEKLLGSLVDRVVKELQKELTHGVKRSLLRSLAYSTIPERHYIVLFDKCCQFIGDTKEPVAIRMFSMKICRQIVEKIPELSRELKELLDSISDTITTSGMHNIYSKTLLWLQSKEQL